MTDARARNEFLMRLLIPTAIFAVSLWYLGSLWNVRMRDQNLILVQPVVVAIIPFYFWVIVFEIRRYRGAVADAAVPGAPAPANLDHLKMMAASVAAVALFYLFGAVPATVVVLVASLLMLGIRKPLLLALVPAGTTLVLWVVFIEIFGIRMPMFDVPW